MAFTRVFLGIGFLSGMMWNLSSCITSHAQDEARQTRVPDRIEQRVDSVLALMTMEEKVGQLVQYSAFAELTGPGVKEGHTQQKYERIKSGGVGSLLNVVNTEAAREAQELAVENSRLGIPMIFGYDVIHGYKTMFPVPLGEAASWDMEAIETSARIAAREAAAAGIHWTFAPMIDISRDARWGRIMEGAGEDPYLGSRIAEARIRGFQGDDLSDPLTIAACAKHFAGYGFTEDGRDYNTVDISRHTLWNVILPPFEAAVDAGVATAMSAFNEIGGVPSTGNDYLTRDILKEQWGFKGFVVSDWASIEEMIDHGFAADRLHAAHLAIDAGVDMDMEGYCYDAHLEDLISEGQVSADYLDDAVRRVLRVKFALGIMDDPFRYIDSTREAQMIYSEEHRAMARDAARKSIVLLKSERDLLPLSTEGGPVAIIGPLAKDKDTPLGNWRAQAITNSAVSLYEGITAALGDAREVLYAEGCKLSVGPRTFANPLTFEQENRSGFAEARRIARQAETVILALGEDSQQTGEGRSQTNISLPGLQQELLEEVYAVNKNIIVVLMTGRPLEINWMDRHIPAALLSWHLGSEAGHAIADVLFGDYNPSGKLPVSFPRSVGQMPLYYAQKNTGRPGPLENEVFWAHYTDESNDPLYPFGYGLSYTTFSYSDIDLSATEIKPDDTLTVSIQVRNTGSVTGKEVVQLYIRDLVASETRPVKELKDFQMISLEPDEQQNVTFRLDTDDLSFYKSNGERVYEAGEFKVFVGTNSKDLKEATFQLAASKGKNL